MVELVVKDGDDNILSGGYNYGQKGGQGEADDNDEYIELRKDNMWTEIAVMRPEGA
jgi:hypothetical protein